MTIFVNLVFLSQILVISLFVPSQFHRFSRTEMARYPEETFPLLYTLGEDVRSARQRFCLLLNIIVAAICFSILVFGILNQLTTKKLVNLMELCIVLQCFPFLLFAYWETQVKKLRSKMPRPKIRKANLSIRQLNDFVAPMALHFLWILYASVIGTTLFMYFVNDMALLKTTAIVSANTLLIAYIINKTLRLVHNPCMDPYASAEDELVKAKFEIRILVGSGLFLCLSSLFTLAKSAGLVSQEDALIMVPVAISLLWQAMLMRFSTVKLKNLDTTDYSVYRIG